jgi:hypothetical protein
MNFEEVTIENLLIKIHDYARFPIIPYYYLYVFDKDKKLKEHIVFPVWHTFSKETQYEYEFKGSIKTESAVLHALSTVSPLWQCHNNNSDIYYCCENFQTHSPELMKYYTALYACFMDFSKPIIDTEYYREYIVNLIRKNSLPYAIAQIFARNFAHNIGSHVSFRATNKEVKKRIKDLYGEY